MEIRFFRSGKYKPIQSITMLSGFFIALGLSFSINCCAQGTRTVVAVIDLQTEGAISSENGKLISDYLRAQLARTNRYTVVARDNMEQILKEQRGQLPLNATQDNAVQIGQFLGVQKILTGSIGRLGQTYIIVLKIIGVDSGKIEKTEVREYTWKKEEDAIICLKKTICGILGMIYTEETNPDPAAQTDSSVAQNIEREPIIVNLAISDLALYAANNNVTAAVMDLQAEEGVSQNLSRLISDYIRAKLVKTGAFTVVARENMEQILEEQAFQLSGCVSDKCIVQAGQLLGVRKMFTGSIGKFGSEYITSLKLIDVESGKIEKSQSNESNIDYIIKILDEILDSFKFPGPHKTNPRWKIQSVEKYDPSYYYSSITARKDERNLPHIYYFYSKNEDNEPVLKHIALTDTSWTCETSVFEETDPADLKKYSNLSFSSRLDYIYYCVTKFSKAGTGKLSDYLFPSPPYPIVFDLHGFPHAICPSFSGLYYACWNGASWDIQTINTKGPNGISMAIDPENSPHIITCVNPPPDNGELLYINRINNSWRTQVIDEEYTERITAAINPQNNLCAGYFGGRGNELKCAVRNVQSQGTSWKIYSVEYGDFSLVSIAVDSKGYPHLCYYGKTNSELRYAHWTGSSWDIQIVDNAKIAATSIGIGANDRPFITYMDSGDNELKYASNSAPGNKQK